VGAEGVRRRALKTLAEELAADINA